VGFPKRTERGMISCEVVVVTGSGSGVTADEDTFIIVVAVAFDRRDKLFGEGNLKDEAVDKPETSKNNDRYIVALTETMATVDVICDAHQVVRERERKKNKRLNDN
jgi:hypothetical protein